MTYHIVVWSGSQPHRVYWCVFGIFRMLNSEIMPDLEEGIRNSIAEYYDMCYTI